MKTAIISIVIAILTTFTSQAQNSNFVGVWETTAPSPISNNNVLKIKILATDNPQVFIIVRAPYLKKKFVAKYDSVNNRLYTTVQNTTIYLQYMPDTDMIEAHKSINDEFINDLIRL